MPNLSESEEYRLNKLIETITGIAALDFSKKAPVKGNHDLLDVVSIGLNMLSEALEDTVVSKQLLEESQQKYKLLFSTAKDGIIVFEDGQIIECNEAAIEMFRAGKDSLLGKKYINIVSEIQPDGEKSIDSLKQIKIAAKSKGTHLFTFQHKKLDGELFDAEVSFNSIELRHKEYSQAIIRDISDRKKMEFSLRKSEEHFRNLFEYAPTAMFLVKGDRFLQVNNSFTKLLGYSREDLKNLKPIDITHPDDRQRTFELIKLLSSEKISTRSTEKRYIKKDGSVMYSITSVIAEKDHNNQLLHLVAQIVDITENKIAEEAIQSHVVELERINKELDQFAYVVSHDLKAPLRGISTLASFIEEDLDGKMDEEVESNFNLMKGRISRLGNLIDGILEYSRIGRMDGKIEQLDLNKLILEVKELISLDNTLKMKIHHKLPIIQTSKAGIQQIFQNLLSNAVKYNDKEICKIDIQYCDQGTHYWFSVKDNGPGIKSDYHEKVFGIFQTLQSRDQYESTGVGLSIVKKRIESLGGKINIESEEGKGANFIFTIAK